MVTRYRQQQFEAIRRWWSGYERRAREVNAQSGRYRNASQAAAYRDQEKVVERLLRHCRRRLAGIE